MLYTIIYTLDKIIPFFVVNHLQYMVRLML